MTDTQQNAPLPEGAIENFEDKLAGPDGATFYRDCLKQLTEAESKLRQQLARGVPRSQADQLKGLSRALATGRELLDDVWNDIRK
ncbi:EscE/YscE/SsaE family type III secretion system needle protein co-chaperone [Candidatus Rhodobacter oscarellae]|uniref:EscE/YscE/SsaE family type III secretion system needle protein co-chaperone n=1 Tax=Candidatus Rhodobacter oscarellae TaxID=1675527 RepID=UPI000A792343|nr:EscE/YscE/SsaE family type III secretion system needle protein co-chaperone [Candidatus Rhodobacter lobularis]